MSFIQNTYHIIFATWRREKVIDLEHERILYTFIFNFATKRDIKIWRIGGMPDHIHILCDIPPKVAVADFVRVLKSETSKYMAMDAHFPRWKKWCAGYACVTVDKSLRDTRIQYIKNQKEHHSRKSFLDEYYEFMDEFGFKRELGALGDDSET